MWSKNNSDMEDWASEYGKTRVGYVNIQKSFDMG